MRRAGLALVLVVLAALPARAQTPREKGERLRDLLAKEPPRAALGTARLGVYLGLTRVGQLVLRTEVQEKAGERLYHLEDRYEADASGFGAVALELTADLGADFSVRELGLYVSKPGPGGKTTRRRLAVAPEDGALWVTETRDEDPPTRTKLSVDRRALVLTPPFGVGERLTRLAKGEVGSRLSLEGWDLAKGQSARLLLSFEEKAAIDVRGAALEAQKVTRDEAGARLDAWLDPGTRELLRLVRPEGENRLTCVGREPEDKPLADLPAPSGEGALDGPAGTVLRFLRASGRGDRAEVERLVDADALFARAADRAAASGRAVDRGEKFRATFKKTLLATLTGPEWRRGESVSLVASAARPSDLVETVEGDGATVRSREGGPAFSLRKAAAGWRIVGLPER